MGVSVSSWVFGGQAQKKGVTRGKNAELFLLTWEWKLGVDGWVNSPGREWSRQMRDSWGGLPKLKAGAEEAGDVVGGMGRSGLVVWRLLKTVTLTYVAVSAQGEQPFWDSTYQSCCRPNASQHCVQGSNCVLFCGSLMLVDGFFLKNNLFLFCAALGVCCFSWTFSSCSECGLFFVATLCERVSHCRNFSCFRARDLGARASVVAAHWLSSCGLRL